MLTIILNSIAIRLASTNQEAARKAHNSSILILTNDDGHGTGVLVKPDIVLTANHNFDETKVKRSTILHPHAKRKAKIRGVIRYPKIDVAVLKLDRSLRGSDCAQIDFETEIENTQSPVFALKAAFKFAVGAKRADVLNFQNIHQKIKKGLLVIPEGEIKVESSLILSSVFHMHSVEGESGAAIFSMQTGKVLTLNAAGGRSSVSGPAIRLFRDVMKQLDL